MDYQIPPLLFSSVTKKDKEQYRDLYEDFFVFKTMSHNIHIAIYPSWLEEYSYPRRNIYSWAYHVCIENHNKTPIYILNKTWNIIKENNQVTTIDTKLVTDDVAKVNPNEVCEYTSCITLNTSSNIVKGHFRITDDTGQIRNIDIPSFTLDKPYDFYSVN